MSLNERIQELSHVCSAWDRAHALGVNTPILRSAVLQAARDLAGVNAPDTSAPPACLHCGRVESRHGDSSWFCTGFISPTVSDPNQHALATLLKVRADLYRTDFPNSEVQREFMRYYVNATLKKLGIESVE